MYRCTDCKGEFDFLKIVFGTHGLDTPPYEKLKLCPYCGSSEYERRENMHCKFCGRRLKEAGEYCSKECEKAGRRYYEREQENCRIFKSSPVAMAVMEVADYNRAHGTKYSYGKYFSLKEAGLI